MFFGRIYRKLNRIERKLDRVAGQLHWVSMRLVQLKKRSHNVSLELDALAAQVQENTELEIAAIQLIEGLADRIAEAANDPAELEALAEQLKASASALSAAIIANTPADPTAAAPPTDGEEVNDEGSV